MNTLVISGTLLIIVYAFTKLRGRVTRSRILREKGCLPPRKYPHLDPFFGLDLFFVTGKSIKRGQFLQEDQRLYQEYGRTYQSISFGKVMINTIEPQNLQEILALSFDSFGLEPLRQKRKLFHGRNILNSDGDFWHHSRALIRPTFKKTQIADLEIFKPHVDRLIKLIPGDGSTVDLRPLFQSYLFDTATEFLFGESVNWQLPDQSGKGERFVTAFRYASTRIGRQRYWGSLMSLSPDKKWAAATKTVHEFIDSYVDKALERRKGPEAMEGKLESRQRSILLEEMAQLTDDRLNLRYQILGVFIPAHNSTAALLSNLFFVLARRPDVWSKLREESMTTPAEELSYETIKNMKYLRCVLNEALRLYPPFTAGSRVCYKDAVLPLGGGPDGRAPTLVRKGQLVSFSFWALHRDKNLWGDDAEEFHPERWEKVRPTWEYLPFNGGPRLCVAQQLVLIEAGYVTVRLIQTFVRIENRDVGDWQEDLKLNATNKGGVKVGLSI